MNILEIKNSLINKGYFFPIRVLNEEDALELHEYFYSIKKKLPNNSLKFEFKFKTHLILKRINDLLYNDIIKKITKEVIGPNILCWNSIIFYKKSGSKNFVGWHEDKTFWNLKNDNIITFSIALSKSNRKNGCLKFVKNKRNVKYDYGYTKNNMLARGQNAIIGDNEEIEYAELEPGESSIFRQDAIHGSGPNHSDDDRLLLALRFISPDNITLKDNHKSATLVHGIDNFKLYESEPIPLKDFDNNTIKFHQKLMAKQTEIFAKFKLKKFKLSFLSFLIKLQIIRYFYYLLTNKIN
tara:strand:- start:126 stop:1013 length:888 start_codon:yes stop_codon:yes gene_type:complete